MGACLTEDTTTPVERVTSIRISPSAASVAQPGDEWPDYLRRHLDGGHVHLPGGVDMMGDQPIRLQESALDDALRLADSTNSSAFSVAAVGALLDPSLELRAADYLVRHGGGRPVVLSQEIGGLRFIARERASILNAGLLAPGSRALDAATDAVREVRPTPRDSFILADGSKVGREQARAAPLHLVGASWAAIAQGAAALAGLATATVLCWTPGGVHVLNMLDGVLRSVPTSRVIGEDTGPLLNRRSAARISVSSGEVVDAVAPRELGTGQPLLMVRADLGGDRDRLTEFRAAAEGLCARLDQLTVLDRPAAELAALGASAALPQAEVVRLCVVDRADDVEAQRRAAISLAQTRVLTVEPSARICTMADVASALSYVQSGPVLIRTHVAGFAACGSP